MSTKLSAQKMFVTQGDNTCLSLHADQSIVFNLLIHALILFCILSGLFVFYISKLETDAFNSEIHTNITKKLPEALKQYDKDGKLKKELASLPYNSLNQFYDKESETTRIYNSSLKKYMLFIIAILLLLIISGALWLKLSCSQCIDFWSIFKHNIVIFIFVGIVEFAFFFMIAKNFIPTPPSLLIKKVFEDLKNWS